MSQVIIEIGAVPVTGRASLFPATAHTVEELTSTGTAQSASNTGTRGQACVILNNGTDTIWVAFGEDAAVGTGHVVLPNSVRDFLFDGSNQSVSVINDS